MGCMLRSDKMMLCDVYLQPEVAFETLSLLGELGCVHFLDTNTDVQPFHKRYVGDLCRAAEMQRRLRYIQSEMVKDNISVVAADKEPRALQPSEMIHYENLFEKWEEDIIEMSTNQMNLMKSYAELCELLYVLENMEKLLGKAEITKGTKDIRKSYSKAEAGLLFGGQLYVVSGIVKRSSCFAFEIMLWRLTRGNMYYRQALDDIIIKDPKNNLEVRKVAFLAIFQGEELNNRMEKVCDGFHATIYPCPETFKERMELHAKIKTQIVDIQKVIRETKYHRCKALKVIARQWDTWMMQVKKAKAIYHHLNLLNFDITKNCLIGQAWIPEVDLGQVQNAFRQASFTIGTSVSSFVTQTVTKAKPPTFHRTNKFTHGFQALINAYGDSTYRELNPGLYTVVTFPFLFGLMFGDIGHGIILLIFAMWMVLYEKKFMAQKSDNEIWNIFFGGRYVILLLALYSIYAGFIYNDCFSKPFNIFGSYWLNHHSLSNIAEFENLDFNPSDESKRVYFFGLDPVWTHASNQIMVENSIKMKFSIIIGVIHMMFGIVLSLVDHVYFKRYYAIWLEFIPQIVFLSCLFFWLVFMIYFKWFQYSAKSDQVELTPGCAPQILILFIDMALLSETNAADPNCKAYMFENQRLIQMGLVAVALVCVPILLFGTPVYLVMQGNKRRREAMEAEKKSGVPVPIKHSKPFSELMIHQGVSTIEYVLSTISHTASYLRLWALSLAHAELSVMLWKMVLRSGLKAKNYLGCFKLFVSFALWAAFTLSILVVMEGMSAFLHTLRLHWVEFMSKFYLGRGWVFKPFSFAHILAAEDDKADNICKKKAKVMEPELELEPMLERRDSPERPDSPERLERPKRSDRPERPERSDHSDRPERPERPDSPKRMA